MKKRIFLLLPFLFIMNCEETEETDDGSIEGKWTIQSITHYDGASCSENGYERNFTGAIEFMETSDDNSLIMGINTYTLSNNSSFERYCEAYDNGSVVNDTSCSALYFGEPFEFGVSYYSMICDLDSAYVFDEDTYNCDFNWSETYAYSYDMETAEFCQLFIGNSSGSQLYMESLVAGGYIEPYCGTLSVTGNSATIQLIDENYGSTECVEIVLTK